MEQSQLNPEQQLAVEYDAGHLLIVAGPGTGKTHTITQKIFQLITEKHVDPNNIVAMTFTRKAGEQLTQRLQQLLPPHTKLPFAGTFHSFALRILRSKINNLRLLSQKEQQEIFNSVGEDKTLYDQKLKDLGALDFDGILTKTLQLISEDDSLKKELHQRIHYLFVDEYQDVNETQYMLIKELTGPQTKLCAIGDPDQAIYSFRGADLEHFLRFEKDFSGTKVFHLEQNYRSTPDIVNCAGDLIVHNTRRVHKNLRSVKESGPRITLTQCQTPLSEAIFIAKEIAKLLGGTDTTSMDQKTGREYETHYHFTDIAVIYRTNIQGKLIETALKKEGLPYQRPAGTLWFQEKEVETVMKHLALALDFKNLPSEYLGFQKKYQELHAAFEKQSPSVNLKNMLKALNLEPEWNDRTNKGEKIWKNILTLINFAAQFDETSGINGIMLFLNELKLLQENDAYDARMEAVTLMSIHAAKGLEFPVVFIAGLEEGTLPYIPKKSEPDVEEERRLMYVGLTRAKERLFLSGAKTRHEKPSRPSTFISEISAHIVENRPHAMSAKTTWKKKQLSLW